MSSVLALQTTGGIEVLAALSCSGYVQAGTVQRAEVLGTGAVLLDCPAKLEALASVVGATTAQIWLYDATPGITGEREVLNSRITITSATLARVQSAPVALQAGHIYQIRGGAASASPSGAGLIVDSASMVNA